MRLRQFFEDTDKTAAFAFGRLNPATNGHELLVEEIKKQPGDAFLFLSDRPAKLPTDPLSAQEKLDWAQISFQGIAVGLAKSALIAADRLHKMGYTKLIYLEGEPKMGKVIQAYNGQKKDLHDYNFKTIDLVRLTRDPDAEDATGMSASKLRQTVLDNDYEAFQAGITNNAMPQAEKMFLKLQGIMGVDSVESISEKVESPMPKQIKPIKMPTPPDITGMQDGTQDNGTVVGTDKQGNKTHSSGAGTFTYNKQGQAIKWTTPKIAGLQQVHDLVKKEISVNYKTQVDMGDGDVNVGTDAKYDMSGKLIKSGSVDVRAGGAGMNVGPDGVSMDYVVSDNLSLHAKSPKDVDPVTAKKLKAMRSQVTKDKNILANFAKVAKQAGANVTFKSPANGPAIPFDNGIQMLLQMRGN
tara:strand:- start:3430 stop:4662 length:1233 start_codon:yes stop_codon:yes gene_type:complete